MYYAEGTHPAIIDKEMFEMVRVEMQRRKDEKVTAVGNSKYTSKYPFSGLLICGECGHKIFGWIFDKCRNFFSSTIGKVITVILSLFGITIGTADAVEAGKAIKLNRRAKKIRDDALQRYEEHYNKVQGALEAAGKVKLTAIESFDDFAEQMAKIQGRPEFDEISCKGVELPAFTADDLKVISNNVAFAIEGAVGAGAGAGLGIAVCGLNLVALGSGLLIGGIGLLIAGGHIKKKAIENKSRQSSWRRISE